MRKLSKHEKIAILLCILAVLLLIISCCSGGWEQATGILQGLATGLLSGMGLFFVSALKDKEYRELEKASKTIHKFNLSLKIIAEAYGDIYHKTYHGKVEQIDFDTYLSMISKTCDEYKKAYKLMSQIEIKLITNKNVRKDIKQYIDYLLKEIGDLELIVINVKDGDKNTLNEIRENFYDIQNEAYKLHWDSMMFENAIYKKILHIDSSVI